MAYILHMFTFVSRIGEDEEDNRIQLHYRLTDPQDKNHVVLQDTIIYNPSIPNNPLLHRMNIRVREAAKELERKVGQKIEIQSFNY